jgi:hypothetical protein
MQVQRGQLVVALLAVGLFFVSPEPAQALALTCEQIGNNASTCSSGSPITAYSTLPVSDDYGNTVPNSPLIPGTNFSFYDDFVFTVGPNQLDSITSTINLGSLSVNDLQVRLYSENSNPLSTLPVLGVPNGTVLDGWSQMVTVEPGITGTVSVIPGTTLDAGTYVLEVAGVAGSAGGSYSGVLNLQPVPLPATFLLLLSGAGLVTRLSGRSRGVVLPQ